MLKVRGDIILSDMCIINENHMMYGSWDIGHDGQSFFLILGYFFALLSP